MTGPMAPRYDQAFLAWNTVASYDDREGAQAAVTRLAERGFPVEHLDIVGSDLKMVEQVRGRVTRGKAALAGAAQGVWTGLFVGLLLSLFSTAAAFGATVLTAMVIGAATGAALGVVAHNATKGRGSIATVRSFVAARYDLVARNGFAERARTELQQQYPTLTS